MEKKNLPNNNKVSDPTVEILMQYIRNIDRTVGITSDMLGMPNPSSLTIEPITKKEITFTLAELLDIIATLPQPGGYIHIDDLTKAIHNKAND